MTATFRVLKVGSLLEPHSAEEWGLGPRVSFSSALARASPDRSSSFSERNVSRFVSSFCSTEREGFSRRDSPGFLSPGLFVEAPDRGQQRQNPGWQ